MLGEIYGRSKHPHIYAGAGAAIGVVLVAIATVSPFQGLALGASIVLVMTLLRPIGFTGLLTTFFLVQHAVQFLKRAIFLLGPQPQSAYYGIHALPTVILCILLIKASSHRPTFCPTISSKLLATFVTLAAATTLVNAPESGAVAALSGLHQQLLPFSMFFVGLSLTVEQFAALSRPFAILVMLSVAYGFVQLTSGPTPFDCVWAYQTYTYSIHAGKVFAYLTGSSGEFRAFSYYADPLTWGLFLVASWAVVAVGRKWGNIGRNTSWLLFILIVLGLFLSLTRTPWIGFLVMLGVYRVLKSRRSWSPSVIFWFVVLGFGLVVVGGGYVYREVFLAKRLSLPENAIAARYLTVGTIEARISAVDSLRSAAAVSPVFGRGFAATPYALLKTGRHHVSRILDSHNFLAELVYVVGLPGAFLFLCFYFQWLREGAHNFSRTNDKCYVAVGRWVVALSAGFLLTGYLNGSAFLSYELFLALGVVSGYRSYGSMVLLAPKAPCGHIASV